MKKYTRIFTALTLICLLAAAIFALGSCSILCAHEASEWIVDSEPDYHNDGSQHTVCEKCGKTLQTAIIPQLVCEHSSYEWVIERETSAEAAGLRKRVCKICTDTLDEEEIPKMSPV